MTWRTIPLSLCALSLACTPSFGNDDDDGDAYNDTAPEETGLQEQDYVLGSPNLNANLDGSWSAADGYWTASTIYAQNDGASGTSETFSIVVDGDLSAAGVYPVTALNFTEQVAQDTPTKYEADAEDLTDVYFKVTGFAEDTYLFGVLDVNTIQLSGTGGSVELTSASVNSWPKFGT